MSPGGPDALWSPGELRVMSGAKAGEAFSSTLSFVRSMEQLNIAVLPGCQVEENAS